MTPHWPRSPAVYRRQARRAGISAWFEVLDEIGEETDNGFGRQLSPDEDPQWFFRSHAKMDGIAGLHSVLELFGVTAASTVSDHGRRRHVPKSLPQSLHRLAAEHSRPAAAWKPSCNGTRSSPGDAVGWRVYSPEETASIASIARAHSVSLNTYLLHTLQMAVAPDLDVTGGAPRWMIPVSMHAYYPASANALSYVSASITAGSTVNDLHSQIKRRLAAGEQWAAWYALRAGTVLGRRGLAAALDLAERSGPHFTGLFSNLGSWRMVHGSMAGSWLCCPPVSSLAPFAAAAVIWDGKLGLCLQAHEQITRERETAFLWMNRWARLIIDAPGRHWFFLSDTVRLRKGEEVRASE